MLIADIWADSESGQRAVSPLVGSSPCKWSSGPPARLLEEAVHCMYCTLSVEWAISKLPSRKGRPVTNSSGAHLEDAGLAGFMHTRTAIGITLALLHQDFRICDNNS